jgi:hypothetical protein
MRSRLFVFVVLASLSSLLLLSQRHVESRQTSAAAAEPLSVRASAFAVSASVSSLVRGQSFQRPKDISKVPLKEVNDPDEEQFRLEKDGTPHDPDGSLATLTGEPMPTPSLSFDGISNLDNADQYDLLFIPPDTTGDVGPNHYVQAVNSLIRIYDKSGNALTPAFKLSSLLAPLGTPCSTRNDGDPTVVYDPLADRWLISEFCTAFPPFRQMIAVSVTSDPAGQYFVYEFVMPNVRLNDYPKLAAWTDGYYMSTDEFLGSDYVGSGAFAFDRAKMLAGDATATYIYFHLPQPPPARIGGILPSDLDGLTPPPDGAPNVFAGYAATEYGDAADAIRLFDFHADFREPENSTFRERAESPIAVASFDPTSPDGRTDISQPPPGEWLDSISDRLMYRIAYRNFGDHESLVFNQTVRLTPVNEAYRAGVRVYELRRSGTSPFVPITQSTIAQSIASRWLGSAAQDNQGNIAVAYSLASDQDRPSIMYTGKLATDPPDAFRSETKAIAGTGVQKAFGFRWGDYSGMSIDPADDCTFWVTNEYFTQESEDISDFAWLTRISAFKFSECTPSPRSRIAGTVTDALTGQTIAAAAVKVDAYSRLTDANGSYGELVVVPGQYSMSVGAAGYRSQTVNLTIGSGQTITRNFALEPVPVITETSATISAESCSLDHSPEPGETISVDVALRNTGRLSADDLVVTLEHSGGVIEPSPAQHYGSMAVNGDAVTRTFSFTVSPNLNCGSDLNLSFTLFDGSSALGTLVVPMHAGAVRNALRETFDGSRTRLPEGWSSIATGAQRPWLVSSVRSTSGSGSTFSPDPNQIGLNELISPSIHIDSRDARLTFRNWYDFETTFLRNRLYDGSVLEISSDSGGWQDILSAGGTFDSGGYDGFIDSCCQNPLGGHMGWSGRSGPNQTSEFITTSVKLPASFAGHDVRFRWRVGTDIGTFREGQYIDDVEVTDGYSCSCANAAHGSRQFDFDGDGRTDYSVFRPSDDAGAPDFTVENSSSNSLALTAWGSTGDTAANADFDGDGRTDYAVFRTSSGIWYVLRSSDSSAMIVNFGLAGDRPTPFDFDGDGKADVGVYRPSTGVWYSISSGDGQINVRKFGLADDFPAVGDYDGDGRSDVAVFRPSTGVWYIDRSSDGAVAILPFGQVGDLPVAGDYDGDGKTDIAVYRPSEGVWYLLKTKLGFGAVRFGQSGDLPLQADFDGDGQNDVSVYRPSTAVWYVIRSSDLSTTIRQFGNVGDQAVPSQNVGH